ncbi:hypothetical protein [Roseibium polysiphoniae]|uniref:hypothetical protein n=1 Tax=Roseibium polysiphoniae TaxID=2571221 RepID=UPI0032986D63
MVSVSIIGSLARQSGDQFSDKDLLAIGETREFDHVISQYKNSGWNVSCYSKSEFETMARAGSLFVQHVKQDSLSLIDDDGYLRLILSDYRTKDSYLSDIRNALMPIVLIGKPEVSYWGQLFQADMMFVALRNACIYYKATVDLPEFDYANLISWICQISGLSLQETDLLLQLRYLKYAYRNRVVDAEVLDVPSAIGVAKKLAGFLINTTNHTNGNLGESNGYYEVRALEKMLVCSVGPVRMDKLSKNHPLSELWSVVCNPSMYDKPKPNSLPSWSRLVSAFLSDQPDELRAH